MAIPLRPTFLRVRAERQEQLPDGSWSKSRLVDGYVAASSSYGSGGTIRELLPLPDPNGANADEIQLAAARYQEYGAQESVIEPSYPPIWWPEAGVYATWLPHLPKTKVNDLPTAVVPAGQVVPEAQPSPAPPPA